MGKRKIPLEEEPIVCQKYLDGASIYKLGDEYGMSPNGIADLLKRNDVPRRDNRVLTDEQEVRLVFSYLSGKDIIEVGEEFNVHPTTVPKIIRRHGYSCRVNGRPRQYQLNEFAFDEIDNEHAAYFLGFIYADGYVQAGESLRIALGKKDASQLRRIRAFLQTDSPIRTIKVKTPQGKIKDACKLDIYSLHLCGRLKELGIVPKREQFHKTIEYLPPEMYRHFIRGFVDGDGVIDISKRNNARIRMLGEPDILTWIKQVFYDELGVSKKRKIQKRLGIYAIEYGGAKQARKIIRWLYGDTQLYLERKLSQMEWWDG